MNQPQSSRCRKYCRGLIGVVGAGLMLATFAVFFPVSLMATLHQWLGLGSFPDAPITIYLARSTSLLYAMHGAVMLYVAWHFDRCQALVPLLGLLHVALGASMFAIDLNAGMPLYWIVGEGLPIALTGGAILLLFRRSSSTSNSQSSDA